MEKHSQEEAQTGKRSERENVRREKMQVSEKVRKSPKTLWFSTILAREGREVGLLKRRVRSQLARGKMKKCTPLRREAHVEVKSVKSCRSQSTFGSYVAKKCMLLCREAHSEVKMYKAPHVRATHGLPDVEKVHGVAVRNTFGSQKC